MWTLWKIKGIEGFEDHDFSALEFESREQAVDWARAFVVFHRIWDNTTAVVKIWRSPS